MNWQNYIVSDEKVLLGKPTIKETRLSVEFLLERLADYLHNTMTYLTDRITVDERLCNGKPTIRGMGITVATILEYLFGGDSKEEILANHSILEAEDIDACMAFAECVRPSPFC